MPSSPPEVCQWMTLKDALKAFVLGLPNHQSTKHIKQMHWYVALVHNSDRGRELAWPRLPSSDHLAIRQITNRVQTLGEVEVSWHERRHGVQNLAPDPCLDSLCRQPSRSHR